MHQLSEHLRTQIADLPSVTGVYYFMGQDNQPLYIGKSLDIRARIKNHWQDARDNARKMRL